MNRLAAMQLWPALRNRARAACSAVTSQVGIGQHDERVGAAQLQHALLERPARSGPDRAPARSLPVSVTARNGRVGRSAAR